MTRERPILFSAPMVRAILAGSKTQTRRIVKPQPDVIYGMSMGQRTAPFEMRFGSETRDVHCPYGQPGDRLWVKEQTLKVEDHGWVGPVYTESDAGRYALAWGYGESDDPDHIPPHAIKRRPSIFMTRAMCRITLEVTGVRVELLNSISEADAIAEGGTEALRGWWTHEGVQWNDPGPNDKFGGTAIDSYRLLWESINGAGSWDANPWVWVIEFRPQRGSEAQG